MELNRFCAEKVDGFRIRERKGRIEIELPLDDGSTKWCGETFIPNYCGSPSQSQKVLKACILKLSNTICMGQLDGGFVVFIGGQYGRETTCRANTLPLAICLFAQKLFTP